MIKDTLIINKEVTIVRQYFAKKEQMFFIYGAKIKNEKISIKGIFREEFIKGTKLLVKKGTTTKDSLGRITIDVVDYEIVIPKEENALKAFLKLLPGIGEVTSEKIIDNLGSLDLEEEVKHGPGHLIELLSVSEKVANSLYENIEEKRKAKEYIDFIISNGGTESLALKSYLKYGEDAKSIVINDPYVLGYLDCSFSIVDNIAGGFSLYYDNYSRIELAVYKVLGEDNLKGHTYTELNSLIDKTFNFLNENESKSMNTRKIDDSYVINTIKSLLKSKKMTFIEEPSSGKVFVYKSYIYKMEKDIRYHLERLINSDNEYKYTIDDHLDNESKFNEQQKEGIKSIFNNKISILTGGAGTGKTYTIEGIVKIINKYYPNKKILGVAPTGIAAKRMKESVKIESSTIHRLIGYNNFEEDLVLEDINADFLIVDEASMIDLNLWILLLGQIQKRTNVLIMGDVNQLPPIGPAEVFKDLINSEKIQVTRLTQIYRQDEKNSIIENSFNIIKGNANLNYTQKSFKFISSYINNGKKIPLINSYMVENMIISLYKQLLASKKFLPKDIQFLSYFKKGYSGVHNINVRIQEILLGKKGKNEISFRSNGYDIREGDEVIHVENNYNLGVFNGEVGKVVGITKNKNKLQVEVQYEDKGCVIYNREDSYQLELSYCITVHKSQGNQYKTVIIPSIPEHKFNINKNMIYTAVTRGMEQVILVGDINTFNYGIDKNPIKKRSNVLDEILSINTNNTDKTNILFKKEKCSNGYSFLNLNIDKINKDYNIELKNNKNVFNFSNNNNKIVYNEVYSFFNNIKDYIIIDDKDLKEDEKKHLKTFNIKGEVEDIIKLIISDAGITQWFFFEDKVTLVYMSLFDDFLPELILSDLIEEENKK